MSEEIDHLLSRCAGAYAPATLRAYRNALRVFNAWCGERGMSFLPARPEAIAQFVQSQAEVCAAATITHRIAAIRFAHRLANLPLPTEDSQVRLALRRVARAKTCRPKQALGLTADLLSKIVAACPDTKAGLRDAAFMSVGYDTLCRSSELAAMRIEHLADDHSRLCIPRSKTDWAGNGRIAYLSPATVERLEAWLTAAQLQDGPVFRGLHTGAVSPKGLTTSAIRRLIKRIAERAGLPAATVEGLSGHSLRVGAAQDMMIAGFDTIGIMQAGGWRSHQVLARYVEHATAERMHARRWSCLEKSSGVASGSAAEQAQSLSVG